MKASLSKNVATGRSAANATLRFCRSQLWSRWHKASGNLYPSLPPQNKNFQSCSAPPKISGVPGYLTRCPNILFIRRTPLFRTQNHPELHFVKLQLLHSVPTDAFNRLPENSPLIFCNHSRCNPSTHFGFGRRPVGPGRTCTAGNGLFAWRARDIRRTGLRRPYRLQLPRYSRPYSICE